MARRLPFVGFLLLALFAGCDDGPSAPRSGQLSILYRPVDFPEPPLDPMCPHHYAPIDTVLEGSWGFRERMEREDDGSWSALAPEVPPGEHRLTLVDIRLCGRAEGPYATEGFTANGVPLLRSEVIDAIPGVWVLIDRRGRVLG